MSVRVSACLLVFLCCLALAWSLQSSGPAVGISVDGVSASTVSRSLASPATTTGERGPLAWIPTDAERPGDRGAFLTWVPSDAERVDDDGASLRWVPTDAERNDDNGSYLTWSATDAEREDDVGILVRGFASRT